MWVNVFSKYPNCMTVGEGISIFPENAPDYIAPHRQELDSSYHFNISSRVRAPFTVPQFRDFQKRWFDTMKVGVWPSNYLSNHDIPRQVSRYGNDKDYRKESAKMLAVLNLAVPGNAYMYQGEEIGMTDVRFNSIEDYNCCYTVGEYHAMRENGATEKDALDYVAIRSRDNARTPFQWDTTENAGFTSGKPWLKVNPNYPQINLETDKNDLDSVFRFYQKLLQLRKDNPAFIEGDLQFYREDSDQLIIFTRCCKEQKMLVITNKSDNELEFSLPQEVTSQKWTRILTNREETTPSMETGRKWLPWEAEIYIC